MNRYRRTLLRTACVVAIGASLIGIAPAATKALADIGKAKVITEGEGPRVLYIFSMSAAPIATSCTPRCAPRLARMVWNFAGCRWPCSPLPA